MKDKDNKCSCGLTGHFKSVCFSNGKLKSPPKKQEDSKPKEEKGHALSNSCFSIQLEQYNQDNLSLRRQQAQSQLSTGQDHKGQDWKLKNMICYIMY